MINNETITDLVEQHIQGTDIFLVDVQVKAGNAIRIQVDRPDGISIDECVQISRYLNGQMDRDVEDYSLEVSSPGLGSPFKVKQQFEKNMGRPIDILFTDGTRTSGTLDAVSDEGVILQGKGRELEIKFEEIKTAKAILSFN
ncbi:MAG: ribosome assembly cofactor RimP [Bacteroidota bacterium]